MGNGADVGGKSERASERLDLAVQYRAAEGKKIASLGYRRCVYVSWLVTMTQCLHLNNLGKSGLFWLRAAKI